MLWVPASCPGSRELASRHWHTWANTARERGWLSSVAPVSRVLPQLHSLDLSSHFVPLSLWGLHLWPFLANWPFWQHRMIESVLPMQENLRELSRSCYIQWWWLCFGRHVWLFVTSWNLAHRAPVFMRFPRQEYWNGLSLPSPGDLPDPGIETASLALQAYSFTAESPGKPCIIEQ